MRRPLPEAEGFVLLGRAEKTCRCTGEAPATLTRVRQFAARCCYPPLQRKTQRSSRFCSRPQRSNCPVRCQAGLAKEIATTSSFKTANDRRAAPPTAESEPIRLWATMDHLRIPFKRRRSLSPSNLSRRNPHARPFVHHRHPAAARCFAHVVLQRRLVVLPQRWARRAVAGAHRPRCRRCHMKTQFACIVAIAVAA